MRSLRAALTAPLATLVALVTLVALALLAGCSDDDPSPGDPSSTWTPTSKPETPTSSPTAKPTEPQLPDAAKKATEDGARAFITYYVELINFAQATGDVRQLRKHSAVTCTACVDLADRVEDQYADGGKIVGGANRARITEAAEITNKSKSAFGFQITMTVDHDKQTLVDASGAVDERQAGTNTFTAVLMWANGTRWRLDVLQVD